MLARTTLHLCSSPYSTNPSLRATPHPINQGRLLVVKVSYSTRSSSPRSDSWRSSWRTELEHGSNGNGNGAQLHHDGEYQTVYHSNGDGYYAHDTDSVTWGGASWQDQAVDTVQEQEAENGHSSNRWAYGDDSDNAQTENSLTHEERGDGSERGLFTDAFKEALKAALQRSPLYSEGTASADEEVTEPQPYENEVEVYNRPIFNDNFRTVLKEALTRQQAELDSHAGHGSDDEDPAVPYVPLPPRRREMSPLEEIIATALGASQLHLRRLNLVRNEIEAAIERETKQIERLDFALSKAQSDVAYYKTIEGMMEERQGR